MPNGVPKDVTVNTAEGAVLTYSTKLSLTQAYEGYRAAPPKSKGNFVNSFVRTPISNVLDVLGDR